MEQCSVPIKNAVYKNPHSSTQCGPIFVIGADVVRKPLMQDQKLTDVLIVLVCKCFSLLLGCGLLVKFESIQNTRPNNINRKPVTAKLVTLKSKFSLVLGYLNRQPRSSALRLG